MESHYYAVIMAGGGGTRLWPLSRREHPKQQLQLFGEHSLFQIAVDRLVGLFPIDNIFVVTSAKQAEKFQELTSEIPAENYIIEPGPRDTAAAIGLSAVHIKHRDPEAVIAVVTADHFIENVGRFLHVLRAAEQVAQQGHLVTLGILPTFPATGFGYIQQGDYLGTFENIVVFQALSFEEKPDRETAVKFIEGEDHSWNSGMFVWHIDRVMEEFEQQMPKLHTALTAILDVIGTEKYETVLHDVWDGLDKVSIDFGIMEGARQVAVIPARGLGWSDVGSWNALYDVLSKDEDGNSISCQEYLKIDTTNTMIHQNGGLERMIVTIGVDNLVIVDTGDVLMVCEKDQAQEVRRVVNQLKEKGKTAFL